ncbi:MAG: hypothetical protein ACOXZH_00025 [Bacteroidales bacterium]
MQERGSAYGESQSEFKNSNKDTINGDITAFGIPFVRKGDIIHLYDDEVVELNDKRFFAKAVTYSWGVSGYPANYNIGRACFMNDIQELLQKIVLGNTPQLEDSLIAKVLSVSDTTCNVEIVLTEATVGECYVKRCV